MDLSDRHSPTFTSASSFSTDTLNSYLRFASANAVIECDEIKRIASSSNYLPTVHPLVQLFYLTKLGENEAAFPLTDRFFRVWNGGIEQSGSCTKKAGVASAALSFASTFGPMFALTILKSQDLGWSILVSAAAGVLNASAHAIHTLAVSRMRGDLHAQPSRFAAACNMQTEFENMGSALTGLQANKQTRPLASFILGSLSYKKIVEGIESATDEETAQFILCGFKKHYEWHTLRILPDDPILAIFLKRHCDVSQELLGSVRNTRMGEIKKVVIEMSGSDDSSQGTESEEKSSIDLVYINSGSSTTSFASSAIS